jgi:hypothetical protein
MMGVVSVIGFRGGSTQTDFDFGLYIPLSEPCFSSCFDGGIDKIYHQPDFSYCELLHTIYRLRDFVPYELSYDDTTFYCSHSIIYHRWFEC